MTPHLTVHVIAHKQQKKKKKRLYTPRNRAISELEDD